jgi:hypothetical protein
MLIISMALPANRYRNASIRLSCDQNFLLSIVLGIIRSVYVLLSNPSGFLPMTKYLEQCICQEGLTADLFLVTF